MTALADIGVSEHMNSFEYRVTQSARPDRRWAWPK